MNETVKNFIADFEQSVADDVFVKISFASYKGPEADLKSIVVRKVIIKQEQKFSFTFRYKTRDIVKNYNYSETIDYFKSFCQGQFYTATLFTTNADIAIETKDAKTYKRQDRKATYEDLPSAAHDRPKKRVIVGVENGYLFDLGVTTQDGQVKKDSQDKYRQINKYVEIMAGLLKDIPKDKSLKIADMGAGKGYLTFALYDYLQQAGFHKAFVYGVEARSDLVNVCNKIAHKNKYDRLEFVRGSIADFEARDINIMIALHACDTATDDALAKAIKAGADLIVVAPCCHKQIRREMEKHKTNSALDYLTQHGTFLERQAEMVTDLIRAQLLERSGYKTKVFEFISDAHTPKNVMIVATLSHHKKHTYDDVEKTKSFFGIGTHYLEKLLAS